MIARGELSALTAVQALAITGGATAIDLTGAGSRPNMGARKPSVPTQGWVLPLKLRASAMRYERASSLPLGA
jgi:hypothetical protein